MSHIVEVTPDELATLRNALALPTESLVHATAKIRTYKGSGSVVHINYPLRLVARIKPFKRRAVKTGNACEEEVEGEEQK